MSPKYFESLFHTDTRTNLTIATGFKLLRISDFLFEPSQARSAFWTNHHI